MANEAYNDSTGIGFSEKSSGVTNLLPRRRVNTGLLDKEKTASRLKLHPFGVLQLAINHTTEEREKQPSKT